MDNTSIVNKNYYWRNTILLADSHILNLSKVSLETKDLLPEYSGIYYVIEENNTVWYIGKAKNIRKRWQGKVHHRIYQFENQKQKHFSIYYEQVDFSQLDKREQQQIKKYYPHLNNSPVKIKKLRPTETLFRETIATISDFAFILGVEPPRREVKDKIGIGWLIHKKILDLPIIHICLDMNAFREQFDIDSDEEYIKLGVTPFDNRKVYASKWECSPKIYLPIFRLSVNGYLVEVSEFDFWIKNENIELIKQYNQTTIAEQSIRVLIPESLHKLQNYDFKSKTRKIILQRLHNYSSDLIPLVFDEPVDLQAGKQKLYKLHNDYATGKRGVGSRCIPIKSKMIDSDFTTIDELLISRKIDPNKYQGTNVINKNNHERIDVYLRSFNLESQVFSSYGKSVNSSQISSYYAVSGILNNKKITALSSDFDIVYLLSSVERKAWLLVENYLDDFAEVSRPLKNVSSTKI